MSCPDPKCLCSPLVIFPEPEPIPPGIPCDCGSPAEAGACEVCGVPATRAFCRNDPEGRNFKFNRRCSTCSPPC